MLPVVVTPCVVTPVQMRQLVVLPVCIYDTRNTHQLYLYYAPEGKEDGGHT